eukprot:1144614-Pelagomonas_calceolata.AAC.4
MDSLGLMNSTAMPLEQSMPFQSPSMPLNRDDTCNKRPRVPQYPFISQLCEPATVKTVDQPNKRDGLQYVQQALSASEQNTGFRITFEIAAHRVGSCVGGLADHPCKPNQECVQTMQSTRTLYKFQYVSHHKLYCNP